MARVARPVPRDDHVEIVAALSRVHREEVARLNALVLAANEKLLAAGLTPADDESAALALAQFHRLRAALQAVYVYLEANGGVPSSLRPVFSGTILT